jgi:hypothetical protein
MSRPKGDGGGSGNVAEYVLVVHRTIEESYDIKGDDIVSVDDALSAFEDYEVGISAPGTVVKIPDSDDITNTNPDVVIYDEYGIPFTRSMW